MAFSSINIMNLGHILTNLKLEENLPTWEIGNRQVRRVILTTLSKDVYCQYQIAKDSWDIINKI